MSGTNELAPGTSSAPGICYVTEIGFNSAGLYRRRLTQGLGINRLVYESVCIKKVVWYEKIYACMYTIHIYISTYTYIYIYIYMVPPPPICPHFFLSGAMVGFRGLGFRSLLGQRARKRSTVPMFSAHQKSQNTVVPKKPIFLSQNKQKCCTVPKNQEKKFRDLGRRMAWRSTNFVFFCFFWDSTAF